MSNIDYNLHFPDNYNGSNLVVTSLLNNTAGFFCNIEVYINANDFYE